MLFKRTFTGKFSQFTPHWQPGVAKSTIWTPGMTNEAVSLKTSAYRTWYIDMG